MAGLTKVIFVGNLPYSHSEEQLADVFSRVGPVSSFRIAFEKDSGKPRGFGFCEYYDTQTAESAIRNLQGVEVGGRSLRLDFADVGDTRDAGGRPPPPKTGGGRRGPDRDDRRDYGGPPPRDLPPDLPRGLAMPPGQSATDSISQTLATMPPAQLHDIMVQMKQLVTASPDQARALLNGNPQLAYAVFQSMLMMGVVDPSVLTRMLAPAGVPPPMSAPAPAPVPPPQNYGPPPVAYGAPPPAARPPPAYGMPPPQQNPAGYGTPPHQAPAPPAAPVSNDQQQLIQQVLSLTDQQIAMLPPDQKATIMQIRRSAGGFR